MPLPPPIRTVQQILNELNSTPTELWGELPGYFTLTVVKIVGQEAKFHPSEGIVIKAFLNGRTGEVKTFLAKALDVVDRDRF